MDKSPYLRRMTLVLYLFTTSVCILFGVYDAGVFAYTQKAYPMGYNPHLYMLPLRGAAVIALMLMALWGAVSVNIWSVAVLFVLVYSWWHNGFYYLVRGHLDVPAYAKNPFFQRSTTSTAWLDIVPAARLVMAVAGTILYLALNGVL
jgi:hypothetical protein